MSEYLEKKLLYCQDQREKFRKNVEICRGSLKGESRKLLKSEVLRVALQEENERLKKEVEFLERCAVQDKYLSKMRVEINGKDEESV